MGTAVEELERNISAHILQQAVVANSECILGAIAAGIPGIDSVKVPAYGATRAGKEKTRWPSSPRRAVKVEITAWPSRGNTPLHSQR